MLLFGCVCFVGVLLVWCFVSVFCGCFVVLCCCCFVVLLFCCFVVLLFCCFFGLKLLFEAHDTLLERYLYLKIICTVNRRQILND